MNAVAPPLVSREKLADSTSTKSQSESRAKSSSMQTTAMTTSCACGGSCPRCKTKNTSNISASQRPHFIQPKLKIGAANDSLEQEADRVANKILAIPSHSKFNTAPLPIQRVTHDGASTLNRAAPASVENMLADSGVPLDPELQQDMSRRFSHDFSRVRIHSGISATQSARDINAYAYTVGNNIVFDANKFSPQTREGRHLLAHELTHVVQQSASNEIRVDHGNKDFSLSDASPRTIQRQDAGGSDLDAGVPTDAGEDSRRETQDSCVQRLGGCPNTRPAGIPSPEEIHSYNERCREETGYTGPDVQPSCPVAPPLAPSPLCNAVMGGREVDHWTGWGLGQEHTYVNFEEGPSRWLIEGGPDPASPAITGAWVKSGQWESRGNRIDTNYTTATDCSRVKQALFDATSTYHSMRLPYDPSGGPNSNSFAEQLTFKAGVPTNFNSLWDHQCYYWRNHPRPF